MPNVFLIPGGSRTIASASSPPGVLGFSQRSLLNINDFAFGTFDYAMINHVPSNGVVATGNGTVFVSSTTFPAAIDAQGWPNTTVSDGLGWGLGAYVPDPGKFGGPYILDWQGSGQVDMHFFQTTGGTGPSSVTPGTLTGCTALNSNFSYVSAGGSTSASATFTFTGGWAPIGPTIISLPYPTPTSPAAALSTIFASTEQPMPLILRQERYGELDGSSPSSICVRPLFVS